MLCAACSKDAEETSAPAAESAPAAQSATPAAEPAPAAPPATAASAAAAAPDAPAAPAAPAVKTTRFEDWELTCREPEGAPRQCEVVQTLVAEERPIARIAVGQSPGNGAMAIAVNLPAAVAFGIPVTLAGKDGADPQVALGWRRCGPAGCFADVTPAAELFTEWSSHQGEGRMAFLDMNDRPVSLPYSFRGLGSALTALAEGGEAKSE
ncbi:MAG: invasion associated locus B family protein [Gammaproteobacteria bacterium]